MKSLNPIIIKEFLDLYDVQFDYFECHEILEEAWKDEFKVVTKDNGYVVLLQLAVTLHHFRNGNLSGAVQMIANCRRNFGSISKRELSELINISDLEKYIDEIENTLKTGKYQHINLSKLIKKEWI